MYERFGRINSACEGVYGNFNSPRRWIILPGFIPHTRRLSCHPLLPPPRNVPCIEIRIVAGERLPLTHCSTAQTRRYHNTRVIREDAVMRQYRCVRLLSSAEFRHREYLGAA